MHGSGNKEAAEQCPVPFRRAVTLREQRQELIRKQLKAMPEMSDRQIALKLGVSHPTVALQRARMEESGELERMTTSIGSDGKVRPRHLEPNAYRLNAPSANFRYAEGCLYSYNANLSQLKQCEAKLKTLSSVTVTNYDADGGGHSIGNHSDPVERYAMKAWYLTRRIERLARKTEPITRLLADLESEYALPGSPNLQLARLVRLYYFGRSPLSAIKAEMSIGSSEVYRRREKVVLLAIKYGLRR